MRHRAYRGRMVYLTNGVGETGREYFAVTVQPDGARTLRAQCEMDDDRLLRDVVLTVDRDWRPTEAFVRLAVAERFVGSGWFHFGAATAACEALTARDGRVSQRIDVAGGTACFGTHALHGDAWTVARVRAHLAARADATLADFEFVTFASSVLANGGSGPLLVPAPRDFARVSDRGTERITVPAGTFDTHHVRIDVPGVDHFDVWAGGDDCVPVRLTSDGLNQTYELVALEGDARDGRVAAR